MSVDEAKGSWARDPLFALGVLASAGVLLAFAWPLLLGEVYVHSDLGRFHVPMRHFFAEALAQGDSFLWVPYEFTGFYLHGEGQAVLAHPLNLLQYWLLPFRAAFAVELLRSYVFMVFGTFLLLRRFGSDRPGAAFGALAFTFGSFNFLHFMHMNFTGIVSHVPWILLAADVALESRSVRAVATARLGIALLVASQLLHSHPQVTWMSLVVLGIYSVHWMLRADASGAGRPIGERVAMLLPVAFAVALGFGMASVQLLPMWEGLQASFRAAPGEEFLGGYALAPINAAQLVAPYLFYNRTVGQNTTGYAFYLGAVAMPLLVWALMRGRAVGRLWPMATLGLAMAGLGFVLSLGETGQLYRLQQLLPLVSLFRAPGRYIMVTELGLVLVMAVAFTDLARAGARASRPAWRSLWPLVIPAALSALLTLVMVLRPIELPGTWYAIGDPLTVASPVVVAGAGLLVAIAARGYRAALAALVLFTAVDLGYYGMSYVAGTAPIDLYEWAQIGAEPPVAPDERINRGPPVAIMSKVRIADGYSAMVPDRVLPVGAPRNQWGASPAAIRNARKVASIRRAGRAPLPDPLPRVRLVAQARVTEDVRADIGKVDVATTALVEEPVVLDPGPPGEARLVVDRPGRIRIATDAPGARLVVLSERHHAGWHAAGGTTPCEVIPVYGDFMGCVVPAGRHEIELVFEPMGWVWGLRLTWVFLAIGVGWFALTLARGRSSATAPR